MMRQILLAMLLLAGHSGRTGAALPPTLLEPVYHALFSQQNSLAWQQLINLWPQLTSTTQRTAWQQALETVISGQCGNDLPVSVPAWLDHPMLVLVQRDIPLNRIYRVQLSGNSPRDDLQVSLTLPDGQEIMTGAETEYDSGGQFRLESQDLGEALPAGVYHLKVSSGNDVWQQPLALQGTGGLNWIQRQGQQIHLQPPVTARVCPSPSLEQTLLKRIGYAQVWWQKSSNLQLQHWPPRPDAADLWANVSVIRVEARGGLTLRFEHRLAGPLLTLQN